MRLPAPKYILEFIILVIVFQIAAEYIRHYGEAPILTTTPVATATPANDRFIIPAAINPNASACIYGFWGLAWLFYAAS